jgi:hypothetical protein
MQARLNDAALQQNSELAALKEQLASALVRVFVRISAFHTTLGTHR